jgi:protein-S-isoprenylcysteine O-methyltransferase Ste14
MSTSLLIAAGTYLGLGLCAVHVWRRGWTAQCWPGARTAWFAGWLAVSLLCVSRALDGASPFVNLIFGLLPAAWAMAADFAVREWRVPRPIAWTAATLATAGFATLGGGLSAGLASGVGVGLSGFLNAALHEHRWRPARLVAWWMSFIGTFAGLLPVAIAQYLGQLSLRHPVAGGVLAGLGALLTMGATRSLTRGVGTPDPWDPPERLVTTGLYARSRHPMQLAHVLLVWAGALAIGSLATLIYAAAFTAVLMGPVRIAEEQVLARRYGEAFHQYRARVRAYL